MKSIENRNGEFIRLEEDKNRQKHWKRWGPYLSERQWGTVREDYSDHGTAWDYFPHDHARSRAYRWGEDGLLGITDSQNRLCFALALWNGRDPILKERLFGLTGSEGNHGEDVKEYYFYLDSTPTHSYMKALYKYPQAEFPYHRLVSENRARGIHQTEFELADSGVLNESRYFDVFAEYAKASVNDIVIRVTIANRGPEASVIHLLPTLWFRNTWSWGCIHEGCEIKPRMQKSGERTIEANQASLGKFRFEVEEGPDGKLPELLFTENETNTERLFNFKNKTPYAKDSFHDYVIHQKKESVNPKNTGTKAAAYYKVNIPAGKEIVLRFRLVDQNENKEKLSAREIDRIFDIRINEADEFYAEKIQDELSKDEKNVIRQAYAGLLWSKQFYHYSLKDWLEGDSNQPTPSEGRKYGRNSEWQHLFNRDIISMPDKWEYPWYAAWDLAFHMITFAKIDPDFAKGQLVLFLREWYMHPNGQIPAYEWAFGDVNPPVHAWACWRVYKMTGAKENRDIQFLEKTFHKLLLNFTWWVNRKDPDGHNIFSGGFLGLDNIGVFDRSSPLPTGGHLEQADGTAWMAFYCGTMLSIALELAKHNPAYEDIASKFFEHFVAIIDAMNHLGGKGLWDEEDGFYYDQIHLDHTTLPLKLRTLVGVIPLFAAEILEEDTIKHLPGFTKRMKWFLEHRKDLAKQISFMDAAEHDHEKHTLLAVPSIDRLKKVLRYALDENEFLSQYGLRSISRRYKDHPYVFHHQGSEYRVNYTPGESDTGLFGGNSNWRGPIWFPLNYLFVEALERYHHFYGDELKMEFPTGSGKQMNLQEIAAELSKRLSSIFLMREDGTRPLYGSDWRYSKDPHWKDLVLFHEYFHGDTGKGLGASHQTGWTALAIRCIENIARKKTSKSEKIKSTKKRSLVYV